MKRFDVAVIGGGMAGASLAAEIATDASVVILEAEEQPGYHSTGRSAAFWSETYGGPWVQPLTSASLDALAGPEPAFSDRPFLSPRGALHVAKSTEAAALDGLLADFAGSAVDLRVLGRPEIEALAPMLRPQWDRAVYEPTCADIDVAGLHAAYLRAARRRGAELWTSAEVLTVDRAPGGWRIATRAATLTAKFVVNAAGAWADVLASRAGVPPIGLNPCRRTMVQLTIQPPAAPDLPLVIDAGGGFYFKPEAGGRLWLSPQDETPCGPCDSAPEEIDIARAIDRLEQATTLRIGKIERSWAGLRSFAPDRRPVYGFDRASPGFFWFAGQGGFGIQTAPAAARLAAALLLRRAPHPSVAAIDPDPYSSERFLA